MAESSHPPHPAAAAPSSRVRLRNGGGGGGEIVEVQGGHIVRSTGRKDRHSKVCTAKGPRDRRVRLAAHTAIQFYDVQDRLGYDRPSKAVDWLIKKAKSSIDELAQLPPWHPTNCSAPPPNNLSFEQHEAAAAAAELDHHNNNNQQQLGLQHDDLMINSISGASSKRSMAAMLGEDRGQSSSFLPPSLDSDAIADTIKSFFPMGASAVASSCSAAMQQQQFHSFPTPDFLQSRNTSHSQDLKLSLHSFQDPILLHHHHQQNPTHHNTEQTNQEQQQQQHIQGHVLLSGIPLGFDGTSGWGTEHHHQQAAELSRFHRQQSWNSGGGGGGDGGNYLFNSPSQPMLQQLLGQNQNQNQFVSQRGPLQSSNTPSIRAWMDPSATAMSTTSTTTTSDQQYHHHLPIYPSGFGSGIGSFSGFNIPARIQGDQEVHDGYPDKPSSASSDSRH